MTARDRELQQKNPLTPDERGCELTVNRGRMTLATEEMSGLEAVDILNM